MQDSTAGSQHGRDESGTRSKRAKKRKRKNRLRESGDAKSDEQGEDESILLKYNRAMEDLVQGQPGLVGVTALGLLEGVQYLLIIAPSGYVSVARTNPTAHSPAR